MLQTGFERFPVGTYVQVRRGHRLAGKFGEVKLYKTLDHFASSGPVPLIQFDGSGEEHYIMQPSCLKVARRKRVPKARPVMVRRRKQAPEQLNLLGGQTSVKAIKARKASGD